MNFLLLQTIKVIKYEFIESLSYFLFKILAAFLLLIYIAHIVVQECGQSVSNLGFLDCIIYTFRGTFPYNRASNQPFALPILYVLFQSYLLLFLSGLVSKHNITYRKQILLFTKSRGTWWTGKLWTGILYTFLYFLLYIFLLLIVYHRNFTFIGIGNGMELWGGHFHSLSSISFCFALLLPLFASFASIVILFTLELIFSQVIGFLIVMSLILFSSYTQNALLLGNYMMFLRTNLLTERSLSIKTGYLIIIAYIVIFSWFGFLYMKKTDILS